MKTQYICAAIVLIFCVCNIIAEVAWHSWLQTRHDIIGLEIPQYKKLSLCGGRAYVYNSNIAGEVGEVVEGG